MERAMLRGLTRNAAVVLGNIGTAPVDTHDAFLAEHRETDAGTEGRG